MSSAPELLKLSPEFFAIAKRELSALPKLSRVNQETSLSDFLSMDKFPVQVARLRRYIDLQPGLEVLEVGCGYGISIASLIRNFGVDGIGIEPPNYSEFPGGVMASRELFRSNGLNESRIVDGFGERIPFASNSFDLVYSLNVLEHTTSPVDVLRESLRVLKPGGILFFEIPNFMSFFEGHYHVITPPILSKRMFKVLIKFVYRRDTNFLAHLHTEINPLWMMRTIQKLKRQHAFEVLSLGEEEFRKRFSGEFRFEQQQSRHRLEKLVRILQRLNRLFPLSSLLIATKTYYPIYCVLRKL